jgi:exopolyphosphatase/guanosine-5'-triphosphate,3'-diphosphate pyrophosphatase
VFIALAVFYRYEGASSEDVPTDLLKLLREDWIERARVLAAAMRLAYVLTAAMPGLLPQIVLEAAPDKGLILGLRRSHGDLMGETVQKRLDALAALLGRTGKVVIR